MAQVAVILFLCLWLVVGLGAVLAGSYMAITTYRGSGDTVAYVLAAAEIFIGALALVVFLLLVSQP